MHDACAILWRHKSSHVTYLVVARTSAKLVIALSGEAPPAEFRIFTSGAVDTVKGTFLFDDASAVSVMAEYREHGADLMIDYDHASLSSDRAPDPAQAGKAAGWFDLEVRGGELWAVNVRWTLPATAALTRKEWRYMSPAFQTDDEGRIMALINVALTNLPATRRLQPLVAASIHGGSMDPELVSKALDALVAGDAEQAMSILKDMIAAAAGAPAPAADAPVEPPAEMPSEMADKPAEGDPNADAEEEKAAIMAATSRLVRLTGKTTIASAVDEVETWRQSHIRLAAREEELAKEKAAIELGQRKENAKKLVALGAETPHTSGLAENKLCKRLLDEPLVEQTARVVALLAARGGKLPEAPKPPAKGGQEFDTPHGRVELTNSELRNCELTKCDPKEYATAKAKQLKARGGR